MCYLFSYLLGLSNNNPMFVSLVFNFHNFDPQCFIFVLSYCKFNFSLVLVILHVEHTRHIAPYFILTIHINIVCAHLFKF